MPVAANGNTKRDYDDDDAVRKLLTTLNGDVSQTKRAKLHAASANTTPCGRMKWRPITSEVRESSKVRSAVALSSDRIPLKDLLNFVRLNHQFAKPMHLKTRILACLFAVTSSALVYVGPSLWHNGREKQERKTYMYIRRWADDLDWCNKDICTMCGLASDRKRWSRFVKYVVDTNGH